METNLSRGGNPPGDKISKHCPVVGILLSRYDRFVRPSLENIISVISVTGHGFGNLDDSPQVPDPVRVLSRRERQAYIYRSISALVSGLSCLNKESGGLMISYHDLQPSNVLVVGQDFKTADLGRSHLRPADGGLFA